MLCATYFVQHNMCQILCATSWTTWYASGEICHKIHLCTMSCVANDMCHVMCVTQCIANNKICHNYKLHTKSCDTWFTSHNICDMLCTTFNVTFYLPHVSYHMIWCITCPSSPQLSSSVYRPVINTVTVEHFKTFCILIRILNTGRSEYSFKGLNMNIWIYQPDIKIRKLMKWLRRLKSHLSRNLIRNRRKSQNPLMFARLRLPPTLDVCMFQSI